MNREENREYQRKWQRQKWYNLKEKVFKMYGDKCSRCGYSDKRALQLDHVKDDGFKARVVCSTGKKSNKTNGEWWKAGKEYRPDLFQILCSNCNWIKRYEYEQARRMSALSSI